MTKVLLFLASVAAFLLVSVHASSALTSATQAVASAEASFKEGTFKLTDDYSNSFKDLGNASVTLSDALHTAISAFRGNRAPVSSADAQALVQILSGIASNVQAGSSHIVSISAKLKTAGDFAADVNYGLVKLQAVFGQYGHAFVSDLPAEQNSQARHLFGQISSSFEAAIRSTPSSFLWR